jgi:hypothetical protein
MISVELVCEYKNKHRYEERMGKELITKCCNYHVLYTADRTSITAGSWVAVNLQTCHMDYTGCLIQLNEYTG